MDISDRKRAEVALKESESKFRTLAETARVGIFIYQGTQFRYINCATQEITQYCSDKPSWGTMNHDISRVSPSSGFLN